MRRSKIYITFFTLVVFVCAAFILKTLFQAGQFKNLDFHTECNCQSIGEIVGAEDITIWQDRGIAYIAADDRFSYAQGDITQGALYSYNMKDKESSLLKVFPEKDVPFHCHQNW